MSNHDAEVDLHRNAVTEPGLRYQQQGYGHCSSFATPPKDAPANSNARSTCRQYALDSTRTDPLDSFSLRQCPERRLCLPGPLQVTPNDISLTERHVDYDLRTSIPNRIENTAWELLLPADQPTADS
ncbi:MAG: hypothetical protein ABI076_06025 [Acidobacteriaceae bacterium]